MPSGRFSFTESAIFPFSSTKIPSFILTEVAVIVRFATETVASAEVCLPLAVCQVDTVKDRHRCLTSGLADRLTVGLLSFGH